MKCPKCNSTNPTGSKFCQSCGETLPDPTTQVSSAKPGKICQTCGASNDIKNDFCDQCGAPFAGTAPKQAPAPEPTYSRTKGTYAGVPQRKSNPAGIIIGVVAGLLVLGVGGYFAYNTLNKPANETTSVAKSSKAKSSTEKESSSVASSSSETSSSSSSFDEAKVKELVANDIGGIAGDKTVYVAPMNEDTSYLLNNQTQSAASVIKLFILAAAYAQQKIGTINLDDTYTLSNADKVGGTGVIQNMPAGKTFTYRELLAYMIDESDNTAANIMIDALGGIDKVNAQIEKMGAHDTKLQRKMMDTKSLEAGRDNITSAADVGELLKKVYNHKLISKSDSAEFLDILNKNRDHDKLVRDLPTGAKVYNKTGIMQNYGILNDAAIIENEKGAFVVVVLTQNGDNNEEQVAMNKLGLDLYNTLLQ
ncbi:serine hydrolase [Ligilactobacillus murinus]|uniref:serine hydrolase n=1 Tax=Ligilactobacillus murinus TaxID=1622 RepID=UPI001C8C3FBB|nr:serine hydrolase [Ligilactobacillus murinus]MBX9011833.1 serine hydrolase [Ligilactobacillus murinus]